jgi:hypothetical protein
MKAGAATVVCAEALQGKSAGAAHEIDKDLQAPLVYHDRAWYRLNDDGKLD